VFAAPAAGFALAHGVTAEDPLSAHSADASDARDLTITPGNDGDHKDAWGRDESTLEFTFDLSDGTGSGTVEPVFTASWS